MPSKWSSSSQKGRERYRGRSSCVVYFRHVVIYTWDFSITCLETGNRKYSQAMGARRKAGSRWSRERWSGWGMANHDNCMYMYERQHLTFTTHKASCVHPVFHMWKSKAHGNCFHCAENDIPKTMLIPSSSAAGSTTTSVVLQRRTNARSKSKIKAKLQIMPLGV